MSVQKRSTIALFFVILALGFATAAVIQDTSGLYKVTIKCPKPNEKVGGTFEVKYCSRPLRGSEAANLRFYLYNANGYFATLTKDAPVDGKEHKFSVDLSVVPATDTYTLKVQEVYVPAPGKNAQYYNAEIPIVKK